MQWYLDLLSRLPVMVLVTMSAATVIGGDLFAKIWSTNQRPVLFILTIVCYGLSGFFFIPTLLREGLVLTSLVWSLITIVGFLIIGLVIFHETLTPLQTIGAILGVIALLILSAS